MKSTGLAALAVFVASASAALADPPPQLRAGEWETRNDNGPAHRICERNDHAFDAVAVNRMLSAGGTKCAPAEVHTSGPVTTYSSTCVIAGGRLTTHGVMTSHGPDAYTSRSQSHYEGGTMKLPDMDMTQVSRRLGPCQPGDTISKY